MGFYIAGTGRAVPEKLVTNDELSNYVDTSDEWISQRTGIRSRYISTGETTTELATKAALNALEMAGWDADSIDLIVAGTVSSDTFYPSLACSVQANIGAVNATAFDVNAACSGFMFGVQIADGYFNSGTAKRALIIGAEVLSKMMDWNDRTSCVLFGDGAGAAVLEASDKEEHKVTFVSGSDGAGGGALTCSNRPVNNLFVKNDAALDYTWMDGQAVFKFAVKTVPAAIKEVLEKAGKTTEDVDIFLLHQANLRIIESVAKRLSSPMDKFPTILEEYGNVSAGSVPILLDIQNRNGTLKRGDTVVMSGFGAGLTWAASIFRF